MQLKNEIVVLCLVGYVMNSQTAVKSWPNVPITFNLAAAEPRIMW